MTTIEELNKIFRIVFDDDTLRIRPDTTANEIDGWDSLSHFNLISAIEVHLNIRFAVEELTKHRNVGNIVADIDLKRSIA